MTRLTFATGAVAGAAVAALMIVPSSLSAEGDDLRQPEPPTHCADISCRVLPSAKSLQLERRLERRGFVCTGKARLSDSVIVDLDAGARVLPFDEAMQVGGEGVGWMRSYCSQP
jgi:hypothetical protein